ncbi:MAG: hypothetical protein K6347_08295 [Campylobacterales bacterium]
MALFFYVAALFFLPKEGLYYTLEEEMNRSRIVLSQERLSHSWGILRVHDALLYIEDLAVGKIGQINVYLFGPVNRVVVTDMEVLGDLLTLVPGEIDSIELSHTLWSPLTLNIQGIGDFGTIHGTIDLMEKKIVLLLEPSALAMTRYRPLLMKFKRTKEGLVYESVYH